MFSCPSFQSHSLDYRQPSSSSQIWVDDSATEIDLSWGVKTSTSLTRSINVQRWVIIMMNWLLFYEYTIIFLFFICYPQKYLLFTPWNLYFGLTDLQTWRCHELRWHHCIVTVTYCSSKYTSRWDMAVTAVYLKCWTEHRVETYCIR